jgi:hypothetical protein
MEGEHEALLYIGDSSRYVQNDSGLQILVVNIENYEFCLLGRLIELICKRVLHGLLLNMNWRDRLDASIYLRDMSIRPWIASDKIWLQDRMLRWIYAIHRRHGGRW